MSGRLCLRDYGQAELPTGLHCYDLDATGAKLVALPNDLRVDSRLILDDCPFLESLPRGLRAGSISLRNCPSLQALPEGLDCWFLDLTACTRFAHWPQRAAIRNGALVLRDCTAVRSLPGWLGRLSVLDLSGCSSLDCIPDGIEVSSWVDVGDSAITGLPPSHKCAPLRWRGVRVDERIAFQPGLLTARKALRETNAERRRVMIERMGYLRFAREADPVVLDQDVDCGGPRQLLSIDLAEDEPLVGLSCRCPSTGRQYLIRVPPTVTGCHQAAAWIAGFDDPASYSPIVET